MAEVLISDNGKSDVESQPSVKKSRNECANAVDDEKNKCINPRNPKKRKKASNKHNMHTLMKHKSDDYNKDETQYYFENGFRKVYPYYFTFHTFCKGRWLGKTLREIFTSEFRFHSIEHYERARESGDLQVNMQTVDSLDIKLRDNDLLSSKLHRHEASVVASEIKILHDDSHYLVVNKPSSIPIHPCGRYRNNTLCHILRKEFGYENLCGCHRLDRLTSGIVIFAKTKHFANKITTEIRERKVEKEYICKVAGEFPDNGEGMICDQPVTVFDRRIGCCCAWKVDGCEAKDASTYFSRLSTDGETSVVLCKPKTGRTHQIRVHLQYLGYPIVNDPLYNHDAWGEERFRPGPCNKDVFQVALAISRTYEHDPHVMLKSTVTSGSEESAKNVEVSSPQSSLNDTCSVANVTQAASSDVEADEKASTRFSPTCPECRNPLPDPDMKWMVMDLHAYKYKGSDWEFKTDFPIWANQKSVT